MLSALIEIAAVFLGSWVIAVAIQFKIRPQTRRQPKPEIVIPESEVSLLSLLLFLFAPMRVTRPFSSLKGRSMSHRSPE